MSAYFFFRAPHGLEPLAHTENEALFFAEFEFSKKKGIDNVMDAPEFVIPPCRFSVRNLARQGGFSHLLAARGKVSK